MKNVRLGRTEIIVPQNAFGCLPIQRDTQEVAVKLLREMSEDLLRPLISYDKEHDGQYVETLETYLELYGGREENP